VPQSLMCAPLLHGDRALGVINVLDRPLRPGFALEEIDLLGQFAHQAALALVQLQRARRVRRVLAGESDEVQAVAQLAEALARATPDAAAADRVALLLALTNVLQGKP
jgi:GAF domain-containing protein